MKSIEERVQRAKNDLALIIAGLDYSDDTVIGDGEMREALTAAAMRAHEELYWLTLLPADVLNIDAPTTDEREAEQEAAGVVP